METIREIGNMKRVVGEGTRTLGEGTKMNTIGVEREDPTTVEEGIQTGRTREEEAEIDTIKIRRDHTEVEGAIEKDLKTVDDTGGSGNQNLKEEEEEDGIGRDRLMQQGRTKTKRDTTEVEGEIEKDLGTVENERGGRGNLKLNEVLLTRVVMF